MSRNKTIVSVLYIKKQTVASVSYLMWYIDIKKQAVLTLVEGSSVRVENVHLRTHWSKCCGIEHMEPGLGWPRSLE